MTDPRPARRQQSAAVTLCAAFICTLMACGTVSDPIVSENATPTDATAVPAETKPTTVPTAAQVAPSPGAASSAAVPMEHVLDPLLPAPADLPGDWTYTRSDEFNGESAQEDCPGSAEFAEFLGWMRRKVVSTDPAGEIEVAVGHADARADDVLGTLAGVVKLEQCRDPEQAELGIQVLDTDSDVGDLLVAFEVTFPEGRLVWVGAALRDGLVATAQFGTPPAPAGDDSLAGLVAQIELVESRRLAAVDLRLRCEGRFGPGPLREVEIDKSESCTGYREWDAAAP